MWETLWDYALISVDVDVDVAVQLGCYLLGVLAGSNAPQPPFCLIVITGLIYRIKSKADLMRHIPISTPIII